MATTLKQVEEARKAFETATKTSEAAFAKARKLSDQHDRASAVAEDASNQLDDAFQTLHDALSEYATESFGGDSVSLIFQ